LQAAFPIVRRGTVLSGEERVDTAARGKADAGSVAISESTMVERLVRYLDR